MISGLIFNFHSYKKRVPGNARVCVCTEYVYWQEFYHVVYAFAMGRKIKKKLCTRIHYANTRGEKKTKISFFFSFNKTVDGRGRPLGEILCSRRGRVRGEDPAEGGWIVLVLLKSKISARRRPVRPDRRRDFFQ